MMVNPFLVIYSLYYTILSSRNSYQFCIISTSFAQFWLFWTVYRFRGGAGGAGKKLRRGVVLAFLLWKWYTMLKGSHELRS